MRRLLSLLLLLSMLAVPVSAHPGRTDANGGHWNTYTGEYHYHHGHPAHQHYDIDGDGTSDCPYTFKAAASATTATSPLQAAAQPRKTAAGGVSVTGWLVSAALLLALIFSAKSHRREIRLLESASQQNKDRLQQYSSELASQAAKLQQTEEEAHSQLTKQEETLRQKEAVIVQLRTVNIKLRKQLDSIHAAAAPAEGESAQAHTEALAAKVVEQNATIDGQAGQIRDLTEKVNAYQKSQSTGLFVASDGLPICFLSASKPYGDCTIYINTKSNLYHMEPSCAPPGAKIGHIQNVPYACRPCSKCAIDASRIVRAKIHA